MKKLIIILFAIQLFSCQNSNNESTEYTESDSEIVEVAGPSVVHKYQGTIGEYPITAFIKMDNDKISGYYYYDKVGEEISMMQYPDGDRNVLYMDNDEEIQLKTKSENEISGTWKGKKGNKLPFKLTAVVTDYIGFGHTVMKLENCDNVEKAKKKPAAERMFFDSICSKMDLDILNVRLENKTIADKINQLLIHETYSDKVNSISEIEKDYNMRATNDDEGEGISGSENNDESSVFYYDDKLLVIALNNYFYPYGAAHGGFNISYLNIDLNTGEVITFDEIIPKSKREEFNKVLYANFKKKYNPKDFWLDDENSFYKVENIALNDKGLLMQYNQYEIASYAQGTTEVFIPYSELKGIMNIPNALKINP